jgi:hypothetical protein
VLGGGRHFSTEVARVTNGAALLPEEASELMRREHPLSVASGETEAPSEADARAEAAK